MTNEKAPQPADVHALDLTEKWIERLKGQSFGDIGTMRTELGAALTAAHVLVGADASPRGDARRKAVEGLQNAFLKHRGEQASDSPDRLIIAELEAARSAADGVLRGKTT